MEMAKLFGVTQGSYSGWENGAEPDYKTLIKIARFFGISLDDLLSADLDEMTMAISPLPSMLDVEELNEKVENLMSVVEALAIRVGVDLNEIKDLNNG